MRTSADPHDLSDRIAGLSPAKRALLELRLKASAASKPESDAIVRTDSTGAPLSFPQQRLWWLDQLEPGNPAYNVPRAIRMSGALNVTALQRSLEEIVARHESLRTVFIVDEDGSPVEHVLPAASVPMPVIDLSTLAADARESRAAALALEEAERPFNLASGPLARATLLRLAAREHVLLWTVHHIVSDGWSAGVFFRELGALYEAFAQGRSSPLPPLPVQYADFARWQRARMTGALLDELLSYWRRQLAGAPPVLELPADHARPPVHRYRGGLIAAALPRREADGLRALGRAEGSTLFMTLLAVFEVLLWRYTEQTDIVVGTPIAARNRAELEGLIGCFTNTLVLRTDLSGDPTFAALLSRVHETALDAYAHQELPFEKLVEDLQPQRDLARNPLFQVLFVLQNAPREPLQLPGIELREIDLELRSSKFDLALYVSERADGTLWLGLEYNTDLFVAATVDRLVGHLVTLIGGVVANPEARISELPLLPPAEESTLRALGRGPAVPTTLATVVEGIEAQAKRTPDAVAVGDGTTTLTYQALVQRADALAKELARRGVARDVPVGVCLTRTVDLPVTLLAVWKAGGAYVPLDHAYPSERLAFMMEDAALGLVVAETSTAGALPAGGASRLLLDAQPPPDAHEDGERRLPAPGADDLAYLIYTSGSTGRPKGVEIAHGALANALVSLAARPGVHASDRLLAVTTLAFDIAGVELWLPLIVGARVELVSRETASDGAALREALRARGATLMQATPATWRLLVEAGWDGDPPIRVWCGGEALPRDLADELRARSRAPVWNLYGPTETTIWSAAGTVPAGPGPVPIGEALANTDFVVLDPRGRRVPLGVPGELYIGGRGLARGYHGRPELTAERFVPAPWAPDVSLYRTGDRVRARADGTLEYLGRFDDQVKLRGFRIELGEIESTLRAQPGIRDAVATVHGAGSADALLVAHVVPDAWTADTSPALREALRTALPDYMVPAVIAPIDRIPRTPNGKVDRRALPAPERSVRAQEVIVAPRDGVEWQLKDIWESVLGVSPIGTTDNFFDLGGHSLLAVKLFARIQKRLGHNLPLTALFQAPTIAELAEVLRGRGCEAEWSSLVPIQPSGTKPPLFCLHAAGGFVLFYRDLAKYLEPDQPVFGLQAQGLDGRAPMHTRVEDMAAHYIREMRSLQPEGPYYLCGECFGGRIAFEMARQLEAAGERVALLALFNTFGPGYPRLIAPGSRIRQKLSFLRLRFIDHHLGNLRVMTPREQAAYVQEKLAEHLRPWKTPAYRRARLHRLMRGVIRRPLHALGGTLPQVLQETQNALNEANQRYVPGPYGGKVTLFRATMQPRGVYPDPTLGWTGIITGDLEIHDVPGSAIVLEPRVRLLAEQLTACLHRAQAEHARPAVSSP